MPEPRAINGPVVQIIIPERQPNGLLGYTAIDGEAGTAGPFWLEATAKYWLGQWRMVRESQVRRGKRSAANV